MYNLAQPCATPYLLSMTTTLDHLHVLVTERHTAAIEQETKETGVSKSALVRRILDAWYGKGKKK